MQDTWYVLEDGSAVDPKEVAPDEKGVMRHSSGMAVAMRGDAHSSRSVDPEAERAKAKDLKPEGGKRSYRTRESKAE